MSTITYNDISYNVYMHEKVNNNNPCPPFHDDTKMMTVMIDILNKCENFIETGSYMGKTIFFVGKNFPLLKCYSCEIDIKFFSIAYSQIENLPNVKLDYKPSPQALYNIKNEYDSDIFDKYTCFWLDAHWHTNPLYEEIKYITTNFNKFCIFVDDFTIPWDNGYWTDGYNVEKIKPYIMNKEKLKFYMPNYPSNHSCCRNKNPSGYIIITNTDINTFNNLKEVNIDEM
jgi:hypothetical protein